MRILLTLIGPALVAFALFLAIVGAMYFYDDLRRERAAREVFKALRRSRDEQAIEELGARKRHPSWRNG
jgi:hypothetical protein